LPPRRTSSSAGRATTSAGRPVSTRAAAGTRGATAPRSTRPRTSNGRGTTSGRGNPKGRGPAGKRRLIDYPRQGYTGFHRWLPSWRFVLGGMLSVAFVALGALFGMYWFLQVPSAAAQVSYQSSTVYFANKADGSPGEQMGQFAQMKRQIVPPGTIPDYVGKALVSQEDRTFYDNSGVDIKGTIRAFVNNLEGKPQQGASTLTQQYVKNYLVARTKTNYLGKLREAMLALKVSQTVSKDDILDRYLNTIYLGRDSYGVQAAAQSYFGVDAKDLTISQAAMLVGIVPSPNSWDPATAPEKAQARWNLVLDAMVKQGYLDQATRATLQFPATIPYSQGNTFQGPNGYLLQMVVDELQSDMGLSYDDIKRGGYTIVTTIDQSVQQDAVDSVGRLTQGALSNGQAPSPLLRVGVTSIDPSNGAIVALYGGPDYLKDARNTVTYEKIQAGSTFKPYTLIAALEKGIGLKTTFDGHSPQTIQGWDAGKTVSNFNNEQPGTIDLIKATEDSVNTVYAQLNMQVGPDKSADVAKQAGVTIPQPAVASNVLGVGDVHVLDQASGYATIAAGGVYNKPHIVAKVLNPGDNSVAFTGGSTPKRVFQADVIADTTYAMQQVVQHGTGATYIKPLGVPIAGKTGTSTDNKSAWFVGFTPKIVTAVALFQNGADGSSIDSITPFGNKSQVTGGSWPAKLWADYMKPVLALPAWQATTQFPQPAWIGGDPTPTPTPTATATDTATPTDTPTATSSQVTVPDIRQGMLEGDAEALLVSAGLQPQVTNEQSATVGAGRVIRVDPASGTPVDPGSTVKLVVSSGAPPAPTQTPTSQPTQPATPTPTPTGNGNGKNG
jgi:membrane peptidoglycan carboxypeptidase